MKTLAVIGARGGSKGLPGKNIALLGGKPLIAWTIEAALSAASIHRVIVTTDDEQIAAVARQYGADVPFMRPAELAQDNTVGSAPVLHTVQWLAEHERYIPDVVVYLQPTSPFRTARDIDGAVALLREKAADAVVSVSEAAAHPFWVMTVDDAGWMRAFVEQEKPILLRQDLPPAYSLNGAIYVARRDALLAARGWTTDRTAAYIMPAERSLDIDSAEDLAEAEGLIERRRSR